MKIFIFNLFLLTALSASPSTNNDVESLAKKYLGGKYVWGGTNPKGFDCSGYVQFIFKKKGIHLPRTAWAQSKIGKEIKLSQFKKGDLLFFNTDKKRNIPVTHVGVYLENGKFIHAAGKKKGIIISSFSAYKTRFVSAKRVLKENILQNKNLKSKSTGGITTLKSEEVYFNNNDFFKVTEKKALVAPTRVTFLPYQNKYLLIDGKYVKQD